MREFALDYSSQNRVELEKFTSATDFRDRFNFSPSDYQSLIDFAKGKDVSAEDAGEGKIEVLNNLKALVARSKWNGNGFYPIINERDKTIEAALKTLR